MSTASAPPPRRGAALALALALALARPAVPTPSSPSSTSTYTATASSPYGVDVSYPMHHRNVSTNYPWLPHNVDPDRNPVPPEYVGMPIQPLGDRDGYYRSLMDGCRRHWGVEVGGSCDEVEDTRVRMNLRQPRNMVNYTSTGFKKIRAPEYVYNLLRDFWESNRDESKWSVEDWSVGYTYVNYWDVPSYMVNVEQKGKFVKAGPAIKKAVWDAAQGAIEEWTGQRLRPSSMYGIRVYKEGHFLATHVDRIPLVSSAIINVAQDVDEPWPLEVVGHDGNVYNVTMEPGDMVLYESHTVLHGRPFALRGRYYANIFVHFAPLDESVGEESGHPSFVANGSEEAEEFWRTQLAGDRQKDSHKKEDNLVHLAASDGHLGLLKDIASVDVGELTRPDVNGWQPIHEASRSGFTDIIKYLVEAGGADVDAVTRGGHTPLGLATERHGGDHPAVKMLERLGGRVGSEL